MLPDNPLKWELVPDALKVAVKAWSSRLMALSALCFTLLEFTTYLDFLPHWTPLALLVVAWGSRFVAQKGLSKPETEEDPYATQ